MVARIHRGMAPRDAACRGYGLSVFLFLAAVSSLPGDIQSTGGNLLFDANNDGSAEVAIQGKNLGIGTASPSTNLHVMGNTYISQNLGIGTSVPASNLEVQGSRGMNLQTISSNTTISGNSVILADTSSANITLTLPYAGNAAGRIFKIKKSNIANKLSVKGGGNLIDDSPIIELPSGNALPHLNIISNGKQWYILSSAGNVTPWKPTSLSNCILWLDANDAANVTLTSGNVSQWSDKSGQGFHFTQGTATAQPLYLVSGRNGMYVVKFDGTNDQLSKSRDWGKYLDVYLVGRFHTTPGSTDHFFCGSATTEYGLKHDSGDMYFNSGGPNVNRTISGSTNYHYFRAFVNNSDIGLSIDGGAESTSSGATDYPDTILNLGGISSAFGKAEIAEVIIYNMKLATSDSNTVLAYLSYKWGF